jgi:hypothetical protein
MVITLRAPCCGNGSLSAIAGRLFGVARRQPIRREFG